MISKLYIDSGCGFSGKQFISQIIDIEKKRIEFDLSSFGRIMSLKFMAINNYCVLRIHSIAICRKDNTSYEIENFKSNALIHENNNYHFATKNPYVFFHLFNQKIIKVILKLEYIAIGEKSFNYILNCITAKIENSFDESVRRQKVKFKELTKDIEAKEAYINQFRNQIDQLQIQVEALKASQHKLLNPRSWKILSPSRLFSVYVRKLKLKLTSAMYIFDRQYKLIRKSGLFDPTYYLQQNREVQKGNISSLVHYLKVGTREGRDPNLIFDTSYYLDQNPDILESGMNPLAHYIEIGAMENEDPSPLFDSFYYLEKNTDALESGMNPLLHYVRFGIKEGKSPHPLFDPTYYLENNPDVVESGMNPFLHYISSGAGEGRNPNLAFDALYYLKQNPDVIESGMNPLAHYICIGSIEGRSPNSRIEDFPYKPIISIIVPVYNVDETFLNVCIRSVLNQIYNKWELCLVDDGSTNGNINAILKKYSRKDPRVKIKLLDKNHGISAASNECVSLATGEFLVFLDHDDSLAIDALYEVVKVINQNEVDIVYSDEALIDMAGCYMSGIFKPDFSPDLLLSHNYITHLAVVKKSLFHEVGGFSSKYDGAQDYDLVLKLTEKTDRICHIAKVLYHWRNISTSTSKDPEAKHYDDSSGKLALEEALKRQKVAGSVLRTNRRFNYRVKRNLLKKPLISIIIPFKDGAEYLKKCIEGVLNKSSYHNFEIICIDNGSKKRETFELIENLKAADSRIRFYKYNIPFNYSKINNYAVCLAGGKHIVLMNNDIEIISSDWIESLLEHSQREDVGAVGAKLYYPDDTIQHAGIIIGIAGFAGHSHRHFKRNESGYAKRLMCIQNVSAVSGALMMVKKRLYEEIGGLEEKNLGVALNDVDFCLNLRKRGHLNIFTPYCEAYHYESVSRGYEESPDKKVRFRKEIRYFQEKWKVILDEGDPYYNTNLTVEKEDFSLKQKSY